MAPEASPTARARAARLTTIPSSEHLPDTAPQRVEGSQGWYSTANLYDEEKATETPIAESRTAIPQVRATDSASEPRSAPSLTILSAYAEPETPSEFRWWHGVIFGFLLLAFVSAVGIGSWYLWSQGRTVTQTSQASNSVLGPPAENSSNAPSYQPTSHMTPQNVPIASTADQEIERLREKRIGALPSEGVEIISALEQAEKNYPTDYRFPYELSKLSIKGIVSHHEAFEPLIRAAEKAIDNGQAGEMLNSLMADKDGDFVKLSHGHHEWGALQQALRNKNKEP